MEREEAIRMVAREAARELEPEERREHLQLLLIGEGDRGCDDWSEVPRELREELDGGELRESPASSRYDPVLAMMARDWFVAATNEYLKERLRELGIDCDEIIGEPAPREACPCCGRATLRERETWEICSVCWWEDNGQDNDRADEVWGGPNGDLSLTQARVNFLREGISDPRRDDLREDQDPPEKYERGRIFVLSDDGAEVVEPSVGWSSREFQ